jgi:hypothetical protein
LVFAGGKLEVILTTRLDDIPIKDFQLLGINPTADRLELDAAADKALNRFKERVPGLQDQILEFAGNSYIKVWRSKEVVNATAPLTHFLRRLAVQYTQLYYRVEELQTSTHVYFSEPKDAVQNYTTYKKHLGLDNPLVVLRVDLGRR